MSNRKVQNPFAALRDLDVDEPDFVFAPSRLNNAVEQLAATSSSSSSSSSFRSPSGGIHLSTTSLSSLSSGTVNEASLTSHTEPQSTDNPSESTHFTNKVDLLGITNELEKALQDSDDDDDDEGVTDNDNDNSDNDNRNTDNEPNELNRLRGTPWSTKSNEKKTPKSVSTTDKKGKQRKAFDFSSFSKIATETAEEIQQREEEEKERQLAIEQSLTNRLEEMYARERDEFKEKISRMDLTSKHRQRRLQAGDTGKMYTERQGAKVMKRNEARKRLNKAKHIY